MEKWTFMSKNKYENDFIMGIYRKRHKHNDIIILIPILAGLIFALIVAPILIAVCDFSLATDILMIVVPLPVICAVMYLRKVVIINKFIKERNVEDKIEIHKISCDDLRKWQDEKVLVFAYSPLMATVIYNWLKNLKVVGSSRVCMYIIEYTFQEINYLGIREKDLDINGENHTRYEYESKDCILLSDIWNGKIT